MGETRPMVTFPEFLLARYAEREALAKRAEAANFNGVWQPGTEEVCDEQGGHVGLPPADVLADVEAKRRIVDVARRMVLDAEDGESDMPMKERALTFSSAQAILRSLALPYAAHPDYREEWTP